MPHSPRLQYAVLYFQNLTSLKLQSTAQQAWILLQSLAKPNVLSQFIFSMFDICYFPKIMNYTPSWLLLQSLAEHSTPYSLFTIFVIYVTSSK